MYKTKLIKNPNEWDSFVQQQNYSPFVQSPTYGDFYRSLGEQYWILGLYEQDKLVGGSLIVSTHAKRGNFLYLPYGPILDFTNKKIVHEFCTALQQFGKQNKYDFIRLSPLIDDTKEAKEFLQIRGYSPAPMHVLAENSWILDIKESDDDLLKNMKKNHRNLINRCQREGVSIRIESNENTDLTPLHEMLDITEKRHNFTRFSRTYINTEFKLFAKHNQAALFTAILPNGAVDAAAIIMFYGNMAVYRHSASLNTDKRLPSSYLIQWQVIQEAKKRGMHWYNFWGVNPEDQTNHPFAGIGHFKRGFGGFQKDLLHCQDLPLTKKYWVNWLVETIRAKKRGF